MQSIKVVGGSLNYIMMCNDDSCTTNLIIACNNEGLLLAIRGVTFSSKYTSRFHIIIMLHLRTAL